MFSRILVLCTGNICRSPMAEALLRERLTQRDCSVLSAGTHALLGHPADSNACQVMLARGMDISTHRAQQATLELLTSADLILTLDHTHRKWIDGQFPQLRGRAFKLRKWSGDADVIDPYMLPLSAFEKAFEDIRSGVDEWVSRL